MYRAFGSSFRGRTIWHVNSAAVGGGVAEMLDPIIAYSNDLGLTSRWLCAEGTPAFFELTKALCTGLYGSLPLGFSPADADRQLYETNLRREHRAIDGLISPGDVMIFHDPQTAGLVPLLRDRCSGTVWRCHVGHDAVDNEDVQSTWAFLRPYVTQADACVFSRSEFAPEWLRPRSLHVMPSIDPESPKNRELPTGVLSRLLVSSGVFHDADSRLGAGASLSGELLRRVEQFRGSANGTGDRLPMDVPTVVQVSRWDRLKDMEGVMLSMASGVHGVQTVLVGPDVGAVSDDPDAARVLDECLARWRELGGDARKRIRLVTLPVGDVEVNLLVVNALQRHAAVVVQKSLAEGFGLTVTEAMWKGRPVVASQVGGFVEQIVHGESGLLVPPTDLDALATAVSGLVANRRVAEELGGGARQRVREKFLIDRHLLDQLRVLEAAVGN
jgi:trehalose synthase